MSLNTYGRSIFALATPHEAAALHLHRCSGDEVFAKLSRHFYFPNSQKKVDLTLLSTESNGKPVSRYLWMKNSTGQLIDDVVVTLFPSPHSYTGENIIEISSHGNYLLTQKIHSLFRECGLFDAKPGEFTQRAVLLGKIDLSQAEGIKQLIEAESYGSLDIARNNMEGKLSKETMQLKEAISNLLAYLEAHIDFAPDEVGNYEPESLLPAIRSIHEQLQILLNSYQTGIKIREGLKVVLSGEPNAGKSSLYNALLKKERAIVTPIAGTTRDVLEDRLLIQNKEFVLLDTAGLRETIDPIEKIGVQRSKDSIRDAHIVCYVIDSSKKEDTDLFSEEINLFLNTLSKEKTAVIIFNKIDLITLEKLESLQQAFPQFKGISTLFLDQFNIDTFLHTLLNCHHHLVGPNITNAAILISQRQQDKVSLARDLVQEAQVLILEKDYPEKIASLLQQALIQLQEIIGEINLDSIYEKIFSSFCVGK